MTNKLKVWYKNEKTMSESWWDIFHDEIFSIDGTVHEINGSKDI